MTHRYWWYVSECSIGQSRQSAGVGQLSRRVGGSEQLGHLLVVALLLVLFRPLNVYTRVHELSEAILVVLCIISVENLVQLRRVVVRRLVLLVWEW